MANNKSAKKRIRITKRNRLQNRFYKSSVRSSIKVFMKDIESYKISKTLENKIKVKQDLNLIYSIIDKATKRKIFHKNKAARKKSRLSVYAKASLN